MLVFMSGDGTVRHLCEFEDEKCLAEVCLPDGRNIVGIRVDLCIVDALKEIWSLGVRTICSCCGHGSETPHVIVAHADREKMLAAGYRELEARNEHCAECGVAFAVHARREGLEFDDYDQIPRGLHGE